MKKPIPFTSIGIFVLIAISLLTGVLIFLGTGEFFRRSTEHVMVFDQSVNGLSLGSPIKYRGVEVGLVSRIALSSQTRDSHPRIAVFANIHEQDRGAGSFDFSSKEQLEILISQGLRAQLRSRSILSGELYITLDMMPDTEAVYALEKTHYRSEIPTTPSGLIEDFTANSQAMSQGLSAALDNLQRVLANIDQKLDPVANQSIGTLKQLESTLASVSDFLNPDSPVGYQIPKSLEEIEKAAKAIRLLAEYLERNPSSVLFGKSRVETLEN